MSRRAICPILFSFVMTACSSNGNEKKAGISTADTSMPIPLDVVPPPDTDDHNKGSVSEVTLDSPIGPHNLNDTARAPK
jgi:hypothetical protein